MVKHIVVGVADAVYDRLLRLAEAEGKALSDFARDRLGVPNVERMSPAEFANGVRDVELAFYRKDFQANVERYRWQSWILKEWKSVGKRRVLDYRMKPVHEFEAIRDNRRDKVGQYLLVVKVEQADRRRGRISSWKVVETKETFYRAAKQYRKAINRLFKEHGFGPHLKEAWGRSSKQPLTPPVVTAPTPQSQQPPPP